VSVGLSILSLGAVPVWRWLRGDRSSVGVRFTPVLVVLAGAAVLCSLSPERTIGSLTFMRPSAWLYAVAPMFRAYSRFGVVVGLSCALLAGAGAAGLWQGKRARGRVAAALLLALAVLEYAPLPPWRWRDVLPTSAHRWLAAQHGPLRALDCVAPPRESDALALSLIGHDVSLAGPPTLSDCGEPRLGDKLQAMGYTHVLVRANGATGRWLAGRPVPDGLARGPAFDDAWILEVKAGRPAAYVGAMLGFYPREYERDATWRWMGQMGALRFVATRPTGAVLNLELKAFPRDRKVDWFLDGHRQGEIDVRADWGRYELPLGPLSPGETTLTLACREPAIVARDVLPSADSRALGLAIGSWALTTP